MSQMRCGVPPNALVCVQKRIVVKLDEQLKRDAEALAVIKDSRDGDREFAMGPD